MYNSKLIAVLQKLSQKEGRRLLAFIHSPYFNRHKKLQELADLLLGMHPNYSVSSLAKTKIFHSIYQGEVYNELRINNLISDLLQLVYRFLGYEQFEKFSTRQKIYQMQALIDLEVLDHLKAFEKKIATSLAQSPVKNHDFYQLQYDFNEVLDQLTLAKNQRAYNHFLQSKSNALDAYFLINKFRVACDMASRNPLVNEQYNCYFLEEAQQLYLNNLEQFADIPALEIYFTTLQMLNEKDATRNFKRMYQLLLQNLSVFPKAELRTLFNFGLNYCVKQINLGFSEYYDEILGLYKVLLENKVLLQNGQLSQWAYINIVTAGVRLKQYDWTERFIYEYQSKLPANLQENVFNYNLATLWYEKKDYNRALQQLVNVEFTDAFFNLAAKIMQLKIYYAFGESAPFHSLIEATRIYLLRNKQLSAYQKKSNLNFLKLVTLMFNLRKSGQALRETSQLKKLASIDERLRGKAPVANENWLWEIRKQLE